MSTRLGACLFLLLLLPLPAFAQVPDAIVIFKDGFYITGKVTQQKGFFLDPSGTSFTIPKPGSLMYVDDGVRRIYFTPSQVQEVLDKKGGEREPIMLRRYSSSTIGETILPGWEFEKMTDWDSKWIRWFTVSTTTSARKMEMEQRILYMTPQLMHIQTRKYLWDLYYFTKELDPKVARDLIVKFHDSKKEVPEQNRPFEIAKFMFQAGWLDQAEAELKGLRAPYADQKEAPKELMDSIQNLGESIRKVRAEQLADNIERAFKAGQHKQAQTKIAFFYKENLGSIVPQRNLLAVQDLKNKYDDQKEKLAKVEMYFRVLPKRLAKDDESYWTKALAIIQSELNHDSLGKLALFLDYAGQHQKEIDAKQKPSQTTEQVLAMAVTGWTLGNDAAEPDVKTARMLWAGRKMILEYMKTGLPDTRRRMLASYFRDFEPAQDMVARLIRMLPPSDPYPLDKLTGEPIKINVDCPEANEGSYLIHLPPEYHHQRQTPVLVAMHSSREKPEAMLARLAGHAAQHGYILLAPLWGQGQGITPTYGYSAREHAIVLDSLRDARRRFQIDSDRVFLFGWERGADAAFDIGLSHPDYFAGVLPMNGATRSFLTERYWPNAQYLPFYVIQGDRNGSSAAVNRAVAGSWVKAAFPSLYVEYKGRVSEWYSAEVPIMFDWMNHKKRYFPTKELGRVGGEEFCTVRVGDYRFYWLTADLISDKCTTDIKGWTRNAPTATLQARIGVGNEADLTQAARVWTQINIRSKGVRQATLWLAPNMVDFSKSIQVRSNSDTGPTTTVQPSMATMLEEYYLSGDKQRLWFAKISLKL
ncbi:MAG: hypothetical protein HY040_19435 [Planctomycetes bacterium]|nr:hypothetical protein [Planctomycetota bacterium]